MQRAQGRFREMRLWPHRERRDAMQHGYGQVSAVRLAVSFSSGLARVRRRSRRGQTRQEKGG
jgi:hypothetical protein